MWPKVPPSAKVFRRKPHVFRQFVRYSRSTLSNSFDNEDQQSKSSTDGVQDNGEKCQHDILLESGIQTTSALPSGTEVSGATEDSVHDTEELTTAERSILVSLVQVSGQGVVVQDSGSVTQSKCASQTCEDVTGSACVVSTLGRSKEVSLTDCLLTYSDLDVKRSPVLEKDKMVGGQKQYIKEQGRGYHGSIYGGINQAERPDVTPVGVLPVQNVPSVIVLKRGKTRIAEGKVMSGLTSACDYSMTSPPDETTPQCPPPWPPPDCHHDEPQRSRSLRSTPLQSVARSVVDLHDTYTSNLLLRHKLSPLRSSS